MLRRNRVQLLTKDDRIRDLVEGGGQSKQDEERIASLESNLESIGVAPSHLKLDRSIEAKLDKAYRIQPSPPVGRNVGQRLRKVLPKHISPSAMKISKWLKVQFSFFKLNFPNKEL